MAFFERDGVMEPLGRIDEGEAFAGQVAFELIDQGHGRRNVT